MGQTIAILATLDTKGDEAHFLKERIAALGHTPCLIDLSAVGAPMVAADIARDRVAEAGGEQWETLVTSPTREKIAPVMIRGATRILEERIDRGDVAGVIGIGGTQGTSLACGVMQALPYGFPKLMVSTCAAGDTSSFVGVKDITMMFSVCDMLGLNPFLRAILGNAAAAIGGMATNYLPLHSQVKSANRVIGITNLGVLTRGAEIAIKYLQSRGYEVITFHAVGAGGRAMEQMMRDGLIHGVFDYALGEISDELFHGLRAAGPKRLTTAGQLGLPQVLCPGGAEHIGIFLETPFQLPPEHAGRQNVFHSPIIAAPRLNGAELTRVAASIGSRLEATQGSAVMMLPLRGVSRYSVADAPLHDPAGDREFFAALHEHLPTSVKIVEVDADAEAPEFVHACCERLVELLRPAGSPPAS